MISMSDEDRRRISRAEELQGRHKFTRVQCAVDGYFYDVKSNCCPRCGAKLNAEGDK
jgi:uncharacterized OB-fold protein